MSQDQLTRHRREGVRATDRQRGWILPDPSARARVRPGGQRRALPSSSPPAWQLAIEDGSATRLVDARAITRFYALDKYVAARVDGAELLLRDTLDELGEKLATFGFMRVHRGELIRVTAVKAVVATPSGLVARLTDDQEARVSRRSASALRTALGIES